MLEIHFFKKYKFGLNRLYAEHFSKVEITADKDILFILLEISLRLTTYVKYVSHKGYNNSTLFVHVIDV